MIYGFVMVFAADYPRFVGYPTPQPKSASSDQEGKNTRQLNVAFSQLKGVKSSMVGH